MGTEDIFCVTYLINFKHYEQVGTYWRHGGRIWSVEGGDKKALDAFVASAIKTVKAGERVSLVGFGTFSVVERAARTGINPATKQPVEIAAKKVVKFKPGAEMIVG